MRLPARKLNIELVAALLGIVGILLSWLALPWEHREIVASIKAGQLTTENRGSPALDINDLPLKIQLQNLGQEPVKLEDVVFGIPRDSDKGCTEYFRLGRPNSEQVEGLVPAGGSVDLQDHLRIPASIDSAKICLLIGWSNLTGTRGSYFEPVGAISLGGKQVQTESFVKILSSRYCLNIFGGDWCI